jgi:ribosomal protein S27E
MFEALYFGIGFVFAASMFFEDRSSAFLIKIVLAFLVLVAWPYFAVSIVVKKYLIKNNDTKNTTAMKKNVENIVVICEECGKNLRIPKGKLLDIKCPNCKKEWREQY